MNKPKLEIKLAFIEGLKEIVLKEISQYQNFQVIKERTDLLYLNFAQSLVKIKNLRSISRAYVVIRDFKYNPLYIFNHKSILGHLITLVLNDDRKAFKTFRISCAGDDSPIILAIAEYIQKTYKLTVAEDADMKIHIAKADEIWEIGIQITRRPLSVRNYKLKNMSGAMDSTIAYAVNSLCELENVNSYLNIFSGSATLLIEAGQCYPNLKQLIGFDNDKKRISLAIQNIRKAGLITKIQLKEKNIFDKPNLGRFDAITSDLPFGMSISKNENLEDLYRCFIKYCQESLNHNGRLVVYTSEHEILEKIILKSKFQIIRTLELKFMTSVNAYLRPKIFVCRLKQN